jgi:hypothetical protein
MYNYKYINFSSVQFKHIWLLKSLHPFYFLFLLNNLMPCPLRPYLPSAHRTYRTTDYIFTPQIYTLVYTRIVYPSAL